MKWGVRRSQKELDRAAGRPLQDKSIFRKKAKETSSKSSSDSEPNKVKTIRDLSTNDLQAVVNRIQLEKRYMELTTPEKEPDGFVKALAKETGKTLVREAVLKKAVPVVGRAMDQKLDNYLKSKGKKYKHLRDPNLASKRIKKQEKSLKAQRKEIQELLKELNDKKK